MLHAAWRSLVAYDSHTLLSRNPLRRELDLSQPQDATLYKLVNAGYRLHNTVGTLKKNGWKHILETLERFPATAMTSALADLLKRRLRKSSVGPSRLLVELYSIACACLSDLGKLTLFCWMVYVSSFPLQTKDAIYVMCRCAY